MYHSSAVTPSERMIDTCPSSYGLLVAWSTIPYPAPETDTPQPFDPLIAPPSATWRPSKVPPSPRGMFHGDVDANGQRRASREPAAGGRDGGAGGDVAGGVVVVATGRVVVVVT